MAKSNKINLLICTQKVDSNDSILGFFHDWLKEFSQHCNQLTVICLEKGNYNLPDNVKVLSLGKESGQSKLKYILNFYKYICRYKKDYDTVLVHMNPEYICLGGWLWRIWQKKIGLWYMHKSVNFKLWLAEKFTHIIFSATKESFRLKTGKLKLTGHGINLNKFNYFSSDIDKNNLKLINSGRLSPVKKIENLVQFAHQLNQQKVNFTFQIIGNFSDQNYEDKIKNLIQKHELEEQIKFIGKVPNSQLNQYLQKADIFIHSSNTGSLDKSILEAMASGLICFTDNDSAQEIFKDNNLELLNYDNIEELDKKFIEFLDLDEEEQERIRIKLKKLVENNHNLEKLIIKIKDGLSSSTPSK